jgi:hypothetical protein
MRPKFTSACVPRPWRLVCPVRCGSSSATSRWCAYAVRSPQPSLRCVEQQCAAFGWPLSSPACLQTFEYNSRRLSRGVAACSLARDASWPYDGLVIIPMPFSNRVAAATKLRHELLRERKYLTSQLILRLSLQSIMGAMQQRRSNGFIFKRFLATVGPVKHIADEDVERCSPAAASQIRVRYPWANTI